MKRLLLALGLGLWAGAGLGAEGVVLQEAEVDLGDKPSLQRGARIFVNYCLSCHSAAYARFARLARDLEIPEETVAKQMMFSTDKLGNTMTVAMRKADAEAWFGVAPPDLSVIARARGADWLYTFLLSFYEDPARPTGVNNLVFKDTAMPHVLWELQGLQRPVYASAQLEGREAKTVAGLELAVPGLQSPEEYRATVRDLVNFLVYLGEPARLERHRVGVWVVLYLLVFLYCAYRLKKEYWRDVS